MQETTEDLILNIAAICPSTRVLGPGLRFVIWVQGCPFNCQGCISPEWQVKKESILLKVTDLSRIVISNSKLNGLTFSGGEPMEQAEGLAELVRLVQVFRPDLNYICFSGYKYEDLLNNPLNQGVQKLLSLIDVLIDGPYIQALNDGKGLRGSSNQRIIYLTDRLKTYDLENFPRNIDVYLQDHQAFIVGIPTKNFLIAWDKGQQSARSKIIKG